MAVVVFIGDKPSSKNTDPNKAFVGAPSHKTLLSWINKLDVKEYYLTNSHTSEEMHKIINNWFQADYYVVLGNNAAKRLDEYDISYFKLPHPSPRNRKLNDSSLIETELEKCKKYLKNP